MHEPEDQLSAARGIAFALAVCTVFWAVVWVLLQ